MGRWGKSLQGSQDHRNIAGKKAETRLSRKMGFHNHRASGKG